MRTFKRNAPRKYSKDIFVQYQDRTQSLLDWAREINITQQQISRYYVAYQDKAVEIAFYHKAQAEGANPLVVFGLALSGRPVGELLEHMKPLKKVRCLGFAALFPEREDEEEEEEADENKAENGPEAMREAKAMSGYAE